MDTRHDDTARAAINQARFRLRAARYHGTHPPAVTTRVIGELAVARKLLTKARNAVDDWLVAEMERAARETLDG